MPIRRSGLASGTFEHVWWVYTGLVVAVAWVAPLPGSAGSGAAWFTFLHLSVAGLVTIGWWTARRAPAVARWVRAAIALTGVPVAFSSLCLLLPAVHPEPYEYLWLDVDRWLLGSDAARIATRLPEWAVELLQLCYGGFYLLCVGVTLLAFRCAGAAAFDRSVLLVTGAFLLSYLGYLLFPTLSPQLVLAHSGDPKGLWLAGPLRAAIDAAETNPWDCFPSGHTMLTIVALIVAWRWARRWFWWLLVPSLLLIASTVLLRFHWLSDVVAGALLAWPTVRALDLLADGDARPPQQRSPGSIS